jgi:4-hydroxy-tetrahydrodipicolinate synthase
VDVEGFRRQIRFLIEGGIGVIVPCGGTGEFFSLTQEEWRGLVQAALQESQGEGVTIMPSVGGGITQATEMAVDAQRMGCEIVQITYLDPMFGVTAQGVYEYNRRIADSVSIGIMPYRTATFPMTLQLARQLCGELANAVAFKEETGDVRWFREFRLEVGDSVATVCGGGEGLAPYYLLAGADAFTTGVANLLPQLPVELYRAAEEKDWNRVLEIQARLLPLAELRQKPGRMIPVVKEGLRMLGLADNAGCRPPLTRLSEQEGNELRQILEELGAPIHDMRS